MQGHCITREQMADLHVALSDIRIDATDSGFTLRVHAENPEVTLTGSVSRHQVILLLGTLLDALKLTRPIEPIEEPIEKPLPD